MAQCIYWSAVVLLRSTATNLSLSRDLTFLATSNGTGIFSTQYLVPSPPPPTSVQMPPRIALLLAQATARPPTTIASFLVPFVHLQARSASILSSLSDNPGAYSKKIRRGRGPSSGKGKTSGRGQKGQKARGKVPKQFNGGQTPESITHGKMGFNNVYVYQAPLTR